MGDVQDRRGDILRHAAHLFATKGVVGTTVREIADAVGILSGSLYHHFASKDEMVAAIVGDYLQDVRSRYAPVLASNADSHAKLAQLVRASLAVAKAHPHATEIYQNNTNYLSSLAGYDEIKQAAAAIQGCWTTVLAEGVAAGEIRSDVPVPVLYRLMRDALWLSVRWFRPTRDYPASRFADHFVSTFLDGVAAR